MARTIATAIAGSLAALALTAGCGNVSQVVSCGSVIDDAVAAAALAGQGEFAELASRSSEYANSFRDAANNTSDAAVSSAMNSVASDLESISNVDFSRPLDPQTVQLIDRIPISVDALQQACTDFGQ